MLYFSLGSNMGNREAYLQAGIAALRACEAEAIMTCSSLYETAAWGNTTLAPFLNCCLAIESQRHPQLWLQEALAIELAHGRTRHAHWSARTLDIDLLFDSHLVTNEADLVLPHPQMTNRRFVLLPLAEIAATVVVPTIGQTVAQLLATCPDPLPVSHWSHLPA